MQLLLVGTSKFNKLSYCRVSLLGNRVSKEDYGISLLENRVFYICCPCCLDIYNLVGKRVSKEDYMVSSYLKIECFAYADYVVSI